MPLHSRHIPLGSLKENRLALPTGGRPTREKSRRSTVAISVTVPTVEREPPPSGFWSTTTAMLRFLISSTCGGEMRGRKLRTKTLKFSFNRRCDSLAIVSNTIEDLPEPDTPVKMVIFRLGMRRVTFFRLFSRAPRISMYSCCMIIAPLFRGSPRLGSRCARAQRRRCGTPEPEATMRTMTDLLPSSDFLLAGAPRRHAEYALLHAQSPVHRIRCSPAPWAGW